MKSHPLIRGIICLALLLSAVGFAQTEQDLPERQSLKASENRTGSSPAMLSQPTAVVPEFRVNALNRSLDQYYPAIASDGNGNALVVWRDIRMGYISLYGQYLQNGQAVGSNFKIADKGPNSSRPSVVLNADGRFAVAWITYEGITYEETLHLQFGNATTGALDPVIDVADCYTYIYQNPMSLILGNDGHVVLTWTTEDTNNYTYTLSTQKFNLSTGQSLSNIKTIIAPQSRTPRVPRISPTTSGNYVCLWMERDTGDSGYDYFFYGCPLDENLNVTGDVQTIAEIYGTSAINEIQAVPCGTSHVLAWYNSGQISLQKVDNEGSPIGSAKQLTQYDASDLFMTTLYGNRIGIGDYDSIEIYDSNLVQQGGAIALEKFHRCMAETQNNQLIAVRDLTPDGRDDKDVQATAINLDNGQVQSLGTLNDDHLGADIEESWITADASGNFKVFWEIWHEHFYAAAYNANGTIAQSDIQLYDHAETYAQGYHRHYLKVATNAAGEHAVTWSESGICYLRLAPDGTPYGNYQLLNTPSTAYSFFSALAINDSGSILVFWEPSNIQTDHAYFQALDPQDNQRYEDPTTTQADWPLMTNVCDAVYLNTGAFALAGSNFRDNEYAITFQQSTPDGQGVQDFIQVNADSLEHYSSSNIRIRNMAADSTFWVIFSAKPNGGDDIYVYGQQISKDGTLMDGNVRLMPEKIAAEFAFDADAQGQAVIAWEENLRNSSGYGENIYARRLVLGQGFVDDPFILHTNRTGSHWYPDVTVKNDKIYATWIDNHLAESGMSAYASVLDWNNPTGVADATQPAGFTLAPAYPNPFNPQTTLSVTLDKTAKMTLEIFDIRGRLVTTLLEGTQPAGQHIVQWQAANLASGVYLVRARCGENVQTQKLILKK